MGQKVNPHGLRVGVIKDWDSKWYAEESFEYYLKAEAKIRAFLKKKYKEPILLKLYIKWTKVQVFLNSIMKKVTINRILCRRPILLS